MNLTRSAARFAEFEKWHAQFSAFMDESLIAVINERSENDLQSDSNVEPATFTLTKKESISNSVLNGLSEKDIKVRALLNTGSS